jgi:hypothetical protein
MKQVDLREINKIVSQFRAQTRARKKLAEGSGVEAHFVQRYGTSKIPLADSEALHGAVTLLLDSSIAKLKKRLNELGIDPVELAPKKKNKAA